MTLSHKSMVGGVIGVIVAIGLIVAGAYAFGGGFLGTGGSGSISSTNIVSSSSSAALSSQSGSGGAISTTASGSGSISSTSTAGVSSSNGGSSTGSMGTLQISMIDPPIVPPNVVDVYVNYSAIQIHVANASSNSGWYNVTAKGSINLTSIVTNPTVLANANPPAGTYNIIRFNITSAIVTVNSTSGTKTNSTANVPAGMIQSVITGGVNVQATKVSALLVDITPKVTYANGTFTLIPSATSAPTTPVGIGNSAATTRTNTTPSHPSVVNTHTSSSSTSSSSTSS